MENCLIWDFNAIILSSRERCSIQTLVRYDRTSSFTSKLKYFCFVKILEKYTYLQNEKEAVSVFWGIMASLLKEGIL